MREEKEKKGFFSSSFGRFCIRFGVGLGCAFCWSVFGVIIGINETVYALYGWGMFGAFALGYFWLGKKFTKKNEIIFSNVKPKN